MRQLKVILAYDGTDFQGWQRQVSGRTIQGVIEEQLSRMHKRPVHITAAGRTDSGVHAHGQVITFQSELDHIPSYKLAKAMNSFMPLDISIRSVEAVPAGFHPRYDAVGRTYKYYFDTRRLPPPSTDRFSWRIGRMPDLKTLNALARCFVGTHDFSAFAVPSENAPNRVRTIHSSVFYPQGHLLVYQITGISFLWKMVRSIVGSILFYEKEGVSPREAKKILASGNRESAGPTAPPRGLFFHHVSYGGEPGLV